MTDLLPISGVQAATGRLGLYPNRDDLLVIHFPDGANCGGVFTRSQTRSADIDWCISALTKGSNLARALIVNSGNSNAFTGKAGIAKNAASIKMATSLAACAPEQIFVAATGVIGEPVPIDLVANALPALWERLDTPDWKQAASAIMTTDTIAKTCSRTARIGQYETSLTGIAKGSGMIAPDMATLLAFVFTDANLSANLCQSLLSRHVWSSFNSISIDGDTSTSDTLMLFASGKNGGPEIDDMSLVEEFSAALAELMQELAINIVRDGEGAKKLIEIEIYGAIDDSSARIVAASIANSPLVKTAIAAGDANWGRIIMAAGKAGVPLQQDRLKLYLGDQLIACNGQRSAEWSEEKASQAMAGDTVNIRLEMGLGSGKARVWGCDLTHAYIDINGHYRS